jgi:hypothetical protein
MFDLEADIKNKQRHRAAGYIKIASKLISQCSDADKRATAIRELIKLQKIGKR